MALKIRSLKKDLHPFDQRKANLRAVVEKEPYLAECYRQNHPLFAFDLLSLDMGGLRYGVGLRNTSAFVVAVAPMFDAFTKMPSGPWRAAFTQGFTASIRTLLFNVVSAHTERERAELTLLNEVALDWEQIDRFVTLACDGLPLAMEILPYEGVQQYVFHATEGIDMHSLALKIDQQNLSHTYLPCVAKYGLDQANELLQSHLLIQIARALTAAVTHEDAQYRIAQANQRAAMRQNQTESLEAKQEEVKTLSEKLSSQVSGLSLAPKG